MGISQSPHRAFKSGSASRLGRSLLFALGALALLVAFGYRWRRPTGPLAKSPSLPPAPAASNVDSPKYSPDPARAVYTITGAIGAFGLSLGFVNRSDGAAVSLLGWLVAMVLAVWSARLLDPHPVPLLGLSGQRIAPILWIKIRDLATRWEGRAFLVIFLIGALARLYDLAGYPSGIHGDEAEFGLAAASILSGHGPHPFGTAFLDDPALYLYARAPFIALFGQTVLAIRLLGGITGSLALAVYYLLLRTQFGARPALLALMFLAGSGAAVNFSRLGLNVAEVPLFMSLTFLAFWLAQRDRRPVWWLLTGLFGGLGVYFHFTNRLIPIILGLFFLYLFVADRDHWLGWLKGAGLTLLGGVMALGPMVAHELGQFYQITDHMTGRLITNNLDRVTAAYQTTSLPQILLGQIITNLRAFYQGADASQFYTFAETPLFVSLLAPLFILGLIGTLARGTDRRFAFLAIWFWVILIVGGALTIDSPQYHRLYAAILPAAAGMALLLDQVIGWVARLEPRSGVKVATTAAFLIPVVAGASDLSNYFGPAAASHPWELGTMQGTYLAALGADYRAYTLGTPILYYNFSVSRYLAPMVEGDSLQNPAVDLPVAVPADKNLAFLIYAPMTQYLPLVESAYPGGRIETVKGHTGDILFTAYRVPKDLVARQQGLLAQVAGTSVVEHQPRQLGGVAKTYPALVSWSGSIFAEKPGNYRFRIKGGAAAITLNRAPLGADGKVALSTGWNDLAIRANLPTSETRLSLEWQPPGAALQTVDSRWLDYRSLGGTLQARVMAGDHTLAERTDRLIGFRALDQAIRVPEASSIIWTGRLLPPASGAYQLGLAASSAASVVLDGQAILTTAQGTGDAPLLESVILDGRSYALEVHYTWPVGSKPGQVELLWQPPDEPVTIVPPEALGPP